MVQEKQRFFSGLKNLLADYADFRNVVLGQIERQEGEYYLKSQEDVAFEEKVRNASPDKLLERIDGYMVECDRLEQRFSRDAIGISVVGAAGAGKSTLLQSISGLPDAVIPTSDGTDCTGTQSTICNYKGQRTYAEVTFYSRMEMVEQVNKYLEAITLSDRFAVRSVADIPRIDMMAVRQTIREQKDQAARRDSLCGHLEKYVKQYAVYADKLGTREEVEQDDIIKYVAQHGEREEDAYYLYLAVKEARIYTQFPTQGAGKIVLIDTIGMGDTSLGIKEKMIKALRDNSDAAVLLFRPDVRGAIREKDDAAIDFISDTMTDSEQGKWLFVAANDFNDKPSQLLYDSLLKKKSLRCAAIYKVRCNDTEAVEQGLLLPLLDSLVNNLSSIDQALVNKLNAVGEQLYSDYYDLCNKVVKVANGGKERNDDLAKLFMNKLYAKGPTFAAGLAQLEGEYKSKDNTRCEEIKTVIDDILNKAVKNCPCPNEVLARLNLGTQEALPHNVYQYYANMIRNKLKKAFEERINNECVVELQENVKKRIIQLLHEDGRLGSIPLLGAPDYETSPTAWLACLMEEKLSAYPVLSDACQRVLDFRLNIEGMINYKLNKSMEDVLNPNNNIFGNPQQTTSKEETAEEIEQYFLRSINVVAENMNGIGDILASPYNLFYDLVNTFRDKLIFSPEGVKELENFYYDNSSFIWREDIVGMVRAQAANAEWSGRGAKLMELMNKNNFIITL